MTTLQDHHRGSYVHRAKTAGVDSNQGCIGREGRSEAAPEAVGQAVGGGCQSGWGRLLSVRIAIATGTGRWRDDGRA